MYHFFVTKEQVDGTTIRVTGSDVNHIKNVLRMKTGETVTISDGENATYECVLSAIRPDEALFEIRTTEPVTNELPVKVVLFQGLPKGDKLEWITEKAVELGASEIVPVAMRRSVVKLDPAKEEKRIRRYQGIAEAAAKQAGRNRIPIVRSVMTTEEAAAYAKTFDALLVPYECAENMARTREVIAGLPKCGTLGIVIGPEGGFEQEELKQFQEAGGEVITLGKRILRTETAGPAALSAFMSLYGEME